MNFLSKCTFKLLDDVILSSCENFECSNPDLNDFFKNNSCDYYNELLGKSYCFTLDTNPKIIVCAFTISNDSIKVHLLPRSRKSKINKDIPSQKYLRSYPAVLIGRLGVNKKYEHKGIGSEVLDFIKAWFINSNNKTACRFVVVDSYNENLPMKFYIKNNFFTLFSTQEQEFKYLYPKKDINKSSNLYPLKTRLMYFDLIHLGNSEKVCY